MGNVSYRLLLTGRLSSLHPVFHVSQLRPYVGPAATSLPPPVVIEGEEEYEVDRIVGHQVTRRGLRYVVRWKGYGPEEDSAMFESDLGHAREMLEEYKAQHGL